MYDPWAASDPGAVLFLLGLLFVLGHYIVQATPTLRATGIRVGIGIALIFVIFGCLCSLPQSADDWLPLLIKGLMVGGMATAIAWILLPVVAFIYGHTIYRPLTALSQSLTNWRRRRQEQRRQRQAAEEWKRSAPQREASRRQEELRASATKESKRRREQARFECLAFYNLQAAELVDRLPREQFEGLLRTYLSDDRPAEEIEQYADRLRQLVRHHVDVIRPLSRFQSLTEIAEHFARHRTEIDNLPYDEDVKDTLRIVIAKQEEDAIREVLRR